MLSGRSSFKRLVTLGGALGLAFCLSRSLNAQALGGGTTGGTKENLDLPYNAIGQSEKEEDAPEIITFYGQTYEGDAFFYIIDRSGTMQDKGELPRAKREAVKNISEFSDKVQFGVFFFDHSLLKFPQSGQPAEANAGMKGAGIAFVQSTAGGSGTCQQPALSGAIQMANMCSSKRRVIVYLSDGGGTCQGADEATYLRQTLAFVLSQNVQRVQINSIGVIDIPPLNEKYLRNLATQNGGTYVRIQ